MEAIVGCRWYYEDEYMKAEGVHWLKNTRKDFTVDRGDALRMTYKEAREWANYLEEHCVDSYKYWVEEV